ncbi:SDR family oxidoreductase [Pseudalkalibacillus caeni]|uniref:SDR family oxidoreductase n=1 Tax=Exobacillus caeni TaxID=2574798 RepID=A0A5R9F7B4_9BACL|nr:SDR family oxidoreductase [Pseudalkalibacillus caeni]TLS38419.1 SDR family oxidoreductase [Pseudalkalibacillus caeni]
MASLKGSVAIITGASRGVGRETAIKLAEEGCHVVLAARTESELNQIADKASSYGVTALPVVTDVSKEEDVKKLVSETLEQFGKIDILINNAGIGKYGTIDEISVDDYDAMMNTNMKSTFLCSKFVLPEMKKQEQGHILNVASVAGLRGLPNEAVYCATKHAQRGFAQSLDYEARPYGVKVSCISPGGINTDFAIGSGREKGDPALENFLKPEQVADVIIHTLKQPEDARIIEVTMRPMSEPL